MRSIRWKILSTIVPGAMVLSALGIANLPGSSTANSLQNPPNLAAMKAAIMHGQADAETAKGNGIEAAATSADAQKNLALSYPASTVPLNGMQDAATNYNLAPEASGAMNWAPSVPGQTLAAGANDPDPFSGAQLPISGRMISLAVVNSTCYTSTYPNTCGTIFAGTSNGGVWKSANGGANWVPLTDNTGNMAIGALAVDQVNPNVIYAGTGEPNGSADSNRGVGILKSTDGGTTWTNLGFSNFANRAISKIIIDPRDYGATAQRLYVTSYRGVAGGANGGSCSRCLPGLPPVGFYTSSDGGNSFTYSNPSGAGTTAGSGGSSPLIMDPNNPNVLYLAINGDSSPSAPDGRTGLGIYKSLDDGATWTLVEASPVPSGTGVYSIAMSAANSSIVYVTFSGNNEYLYKSIDGGTSWTNMSANFPNECAGQCFYDAPLVADPNNANVVYAGGVANYAYIFQESSPCASQSVSYGTNNFPRSCQAVVVQSTDGGSTWADVSENTGNGSHLSNGVLHPDDHAILVVGAPFVPSSTHTAISGSASPLVFTANDGGLSVSSDAAADWSSLNYGLNTLQFQGIAAGPTGAVFGGTQDNGSFRHIASDNNNYVTVNNGDGGNSVADPQNANRAYHEYYGSQQIRDDQSVNPNHPSPFFYNSTAWTWISPGWTDYFYYGRGLFYEPQTVAPSASNWYYQGTSRLYRSSMYGGIDGNGDGDATNDLSDQNDSKPISPDLPSGDAISTIAVAPTDPNTVMFGTSQGRIFLTHNAEAPVVTSGNCDIRTAPNNSLSTCNYVSGINWQEIDGTANAPYGGSAAMPNRYITSIHFQPSANNQAAYVTYSGFNFNTPTRPGHVFRSTNLYDATPVFARIDGQNNPYGFNLPDMPVNDLATNGPKIFIAVDFGIFQSKDFGYSWSRVDNRLPNVPVYSLAIDNHDGLLIAGTHGRGIWQASISSS